MPTEDLGFIHQYIPAQEAGQPTLLLLHGTGGDENDLPGLGRMLAPKAALLSPRGKVMEQGMSRFFRRIAEGVFDIKDLRQRTRELAEFIEWAREDYKLGESPVIAVGFSNGANIAGSMLLGEPGHLAGAALLHAMVPFVPQEFPDLSRVPVFVAAGRADPIAAPMEAERLIEILEMAHAPITTFWHNGGHSISRDEVRAAREWLNSNQFGG